MRSYQLRCRLRVLKNRNASVWTRTIKIARCNEFFIKPQKFVKNCLGRPFWRSRLTPWIWALFDHFLSSFSSVQKEKMTFWPCFWAIFCTPPCPLKNRFFDVLKKKFVSFMILIKDALVELDVFNVCVTHAVLFLQFRLGPVNCLARRIFNARCFFRCGTASWCF